MLHKLPTELLCVVLKHLCYDDLDELHKISGLEPIVRHHLLRHYRFHYQVSSLLRIFESSCETEERRDNIANQLLDLICHAVEKCPKYDHRNKFSDLLNILETTVVKRILAHDIMPHVEDEYALLCLDIRYKYLHQPSIRVLHDPKYRRRSTKYPLAPFLPREYTWVWRRQCANAADSLYNSKRNKLLMAPVKDKDRRQSRIRFARFFGQLFKVTSLYLESNLDGTFEECVREALVIGDVESLLVMCAAAERPVDVMHMCMMVNMAAEQLWTYLETFDDWLATNPTPEQRARIELNEQAQQQRQQNMQEELPPPEWLLPDRYKVADDTKLRLTVRGKKGSLIFNSKCVCQVELTCSFVLTTIS
ncbi:hypothetical protein BDB00DRAFT_795648 [Zychaea mexicana]|uniref:uncharacterized protein n=1 Tax=Zychaea mexicana TaxID=64656 RepID=UPI0022FE8B5A|nr:uncharacterized protein BDB00DRAFT_795648 [Zychaea mexicana]KAI9499147.1 hypothetical protein BDB00DRAFT_795648 [Zychaea mexicana]